MLIKHSVPEPILQYKAHQNREGVQWEITLFTTGKCPTGNASCSLMSVGAALEMTTKHHTFGAKNK